MSEISVHASGEEIEFGIEDESGAQAYFRLGRQSTSELIFRALQELASLPQVEGELFQTEQPPFLRGRPAFQIGIAESGDALVSFCLRPFATMHFLFKDEPASKLARELSEIIATPRNMRSQKMKH